MPRPEKHCGCKGGRKTGTYRAWLSAQRKVGYPRGPWVEFAQFLKDMGPRPEGKVLRVLDETKPFGPGNAVWLKRGEIVRKGRPKDDPKALATKCRNAGMPYNTVYKRIQQGWSERQALATPVRAYGRSAASKQ